MPLGQKLARNVPYLSQLTVRLWVCLFLESHL